MSDLSTPIGEIPGVGRPAARALAGQGLTTLGSLAGADWGLLASLHGVGPAAGRRLQAALAEHGETLAHPPAPQGRSATVTRGNTGKNAADLRTHATAVDPAEHVAGLGARRAREGHVLLELFGEATGAPATMWAHHDRLRTDPLRVCERP
ncbi:helix-hairpin-helix domain-containing protein [Brachybacterium sp. P6-10-X1]|uniref:helix-hairpin-helix domain-containing protein n=1 Tax=Brachybacterium sp. P6-10-X1 TaxID=1903186 RepID=UPI0020A3EE0D|nr:helix-hairpin-helix domain-containing protein [Brachybacterium sp. P6-10-X1]